MTAPNAAVRLASREALLRRASRAGDQAVDVEVEPDEELLDDGQRWVVKGLVVAVVTAPVTAVAGTAAVVAADATP